MSNRTARYISFNAVKVGGKTAYPWHRRITKLSHQLILRLGDSSQVLVYTAVSFIGV